MTTTIQKIEIVPGQIVRFKTANEIVEGIIAQYDCSFSDDDQHYVNSNSTATIKLELIKAKLKQV